MIKAQGFKEQIFFGFGATAAKTGATPNVNFTSGGALLIPLSQHFLVRPFATFGHIQPTVVNKISSNSVQAGGLLGFRVTSNLTVLGGACETFLIPKVGSVAYLPTGTFATLTKISKHFGILTPVTVNERGIGVGVQLAYVW